MINHGAERRFAISLAENGLHSLDRAASAFEQFNSTGTEILLKDAIMFLHHGVELLMKQILVNHSEYLVFENLQDASRKQMRADELGLAVLFLENPPRTVTFLEAIDRVRAFVRPPELTDYLVADLGKLNRLRNQLEHYAIDVDAKEIAKLIASIHSQLMALFEAQLPGIGLATVFAGASVVAEPRVPYSTFPVGCSARMEWWSYQPSMRCCFNPPFALAKVGFSGPISLRKEIASAGLSR